MNKEKLNQYRALLQEIPKLKKDIERLNKRLSEVPTIAGKVMKSSQNFPYTVEYVKVEIAEPKLATELKRQIRYKELQLDKAERDKSEILKFISVIPNSLDRQIFELMYLGEKRMSQRKVGDILGYDQSSISLKINKYLKDS